MHRHTTGKNPHMGITPVYHNGEEIGHWHDPNDPNDPNAITHWQPPDGNSSYPARTDMTTARRRSGVLNPLSKASGKQIFQGYKQQELERCYGKDNMPEVLGILQQIDALCENKSLSKKDQIQAILALQEQFIRLEQLKIIQDKLIYDGDPTDIEKEHKFYALRYGNSDDHHTYDNSKSKDTYNFGLRRLAQDIIQYGERGPDRERALKLLYYATVFNGGRWTIDLTGAVGISPEYDYDKEVYTGTRILFLQPEENDWLARYMERIEEVKKASLAAEGSPHGE